LSSVFFIERVGLKKLFFTTQTLSTLSYLGLSSFIHYLFYSLSFFFFLFCTLPSSSFFYSLQGHSGGRG
jgi:hypothetical protein